MEMLKRKPLNTNLSCRDWSFCFCFNLDQMKTKIAESVRVAGVCARAVLSIRQHGVEAEIKSSPQIKNKHFISFFLFPEAAFSVRLHVVTSMFEDVSAQKRLQESELWFH